MSLSRRVERSAKEARTKDNRHDSTQELPELENMKNLRLTTNNCTASAHQSTSDDLPAAMRIPVEIMLMVFRECSQYSDMRGLANLSRAWRYTFEAHADVFFHNAFLDVRLPNGWQRYWASTDMCFKILLIPFGINHLGTREIIFRYFDIMRKTRRLNKFVKRMQRQVNCEVLYDWYRSDILKAFLFPLVGIDHIQENRFFQAVFTFAYHAHFCNVPFLQRRRHLLRMSYRELMVFACTLRWQFAFDYELLVIAAEVPWMITLKPHIVDDIDVCMEMKRRRLAPHMTWWTMYMFLSDFVKHGEWVQDVPDVP